MKLTYFTYPRMILMDLPGNKDPEKIRRMFDEVAPQYDRLNRLLSLGLDEYWRSSMVEEVIGKRCLDLACGSGDVMRKLIRDRDLAKIVGLDLSRNMLEQARAKNSTNGGWPKTGLLQGNAAEMPLNKNSFDSITCAFGVRNFDRRTVAFRECYRLLNNGGRFLILEFFPPESKLYYAPMKFYLRRVLPWIGNLFSDSDNAYDYLQASIEQFVRPEILLDELRSSGFSEVTSRNLFLGLVRLIIARKESN